MGDLMRNTIGFFILMCCLFLGHLVSELLPFALPGPVCGMGLFLAALILGIVDEEIIDDVCKSLRLHMNLFFAPGAVNLIAFYSELRPHLMKLLFVAVASTCVVIVVTGWTAQLLARTPEVEYD